MQNETIEKRQAIDIRKLHICSSDIEYLEYFMCQVYKYAIYMSSNMSFNLSFIRLNLDSQGTQFYLKLMDFVTST